MTGKSTTDGGQDEYRTDGGTAEEGLFPVHGRWFTIGFYVFLLIWMGYILYEAWGYTRLEDWLFPVIVGVPALFLLVASIVIAWKPEIAERILPESETSGETMFDQASEPSIRESKAEQERYEIIMIGWVILLPAMMHVLGMGWTLIVYTFAFVFYFTHDWKRSLMVTAIVMLFIYILFVEILTVFIWDGILGITGPLELIAEYRY